MSDTSSHNKKDFLNDLRFTGISIKRQLRKLYELDALAHPQDTWEYGSSIHPVEARWSRKRLEYVLQIAELLKETRILDLGCGDGILLSLLARKGIQAIGLDVSIVRLRRALRNFSSLSTCVQADAEYLPFKTKSMGCVIASEVLEHLPDPIKALEGIERVLKDGGSLIVTIPNYLSLWVFARTIIRRKVGNWAHLHKLNYWRVKTMLVRHGFRITRFEAIGLGLAIVKVASSVLPRFLSDKITMICETLAECLIFRYFGNNLVFVAKKKHALVAG